MNYTHVIYYKGKLNYLYDEKTLTVYDAFNSHGVRGTGYTIKRLKHLGYECLPYEEEN